MHLKDYFNGLLGLEHFAAVADDELRRIQADLLARRYRFLPVRPLWAAKPTGSTCRLGIPTIRERVVQQAVRLLLEPLLAPAFAASSFAYRHGCGAHQAIDLVLTYRCKASFWILESDV